MIFLCKSHNIIECSNTVILIGILTRPESLYERMIMRRIINVIKNIIYVFITGYSIDENINIRLQQEKNVYKDLIIFGIASSYYNCSIIMSCFYLYINNNCINVKWVMKLDIDTYFNITMIFNIINNCDKNISVIGSINHIHKLKCNTNYKWSVLCNNNSLHYIKIPSYPYGPGFLFKQSSISCINQFINRSQSIIWIEDVFFGMIMNYCHLRYIDISKMTEITYSPKNNLTMLKNKIFIHGLNPIEILLFSLST